MMYAPMQSSGTTSSNSAAQRPVIPGNPAGSMHDYGGGARAATAASAGYGTMDPNFNNNNPYIGNNGNVENMKGFECNDLDNSLLAGARANTASATGSVAMQQHGTAAGYGIHPQQNIPVSSGANMQQYNSSYGCMQSSAGPNNGQNFDFTGSSSQSGQLQMPMGPQTQMFSNSSDYSKQQISATMAPTNSRGMGASMGQNYSTDPMANSRRLSTPAMSSNSSQSYLQRSNSYPANSNFDETNQFPPNGPRNSTTSYEQNFNPNLPNSGAQMRNRSYSTGFAQDTSSSNWTDYNMQSKNSFGGMVGSSSARSMYRASSTGQSSQQYSGGVTRGIRYPAQRGAYAGTNSELSGNNYGNTSMQTPSNFQGGKMGMNYPNRHSMGSQNAMSYSQSMNQLQTQRHLDMDSTQTSSQKLRHFGPMPNSGAAQRMSYSSSSQGTRSMTQYPNQASHFDSQVPSGIDSYPGGFQGNVSQYPMQHNQMTSRRTMTSGQSTGAGMAELTNIGCEAGYYNRTKPAAFGPQDPGSEMYASQSHYPNSQGQFDSMPGTYSQSADMSATQTRKNMIFSAELEKLARLSRNPMLDSDYTLPSVPDVPAVPAAVAPAPPPIALGGNQQLSSYQGTHPPPMTSNPLPPCSGMQQPSGRRSVPNVYNAKMPGTPSATQPTVPPTKQTQSEKGYVSPANSAPPTPVVSQSMSNVQRATPERTTASSAPATPATTNQDTTRQTNSADPNINSGSAVASPSVSKTTSASSEAKKDDSLQKLSQSVKDKQDEITKANPNHREYLSDNHVPPTGQNCIAALSAACRNMIADMDNTMPKQSRQSVQSPLGNKSSDTLSVGSMRAPSVPGSVVSGQLTPSSDVSMSSIGMSGQGASTPLAMHMDNFSSPPSNYGNMMGNDYQTQYHDFLEQSVPMPLNNSKQMADKVRKPRKRRKSEDFLDSGANQPGVKKRKPRKKLQNPSSVESLETVQSLDNISECTTLSDSHGQFGDDGNCRSASHTPTSVPTAWCPSNSRVSSADMNCFGPNQLQQQSQLMDTDQSTQDFLDSVFSPDTTMSNIMQDVADSVMMGHVNPNHQSPTSSYASHHSNNDNASIASFHSQGSLPTPTSQTLTNLDQSQGSMHSNAPITNGPKSGQPNNTVSSSGDSVSTSVTTSGDRVDTSSDKSNSEEAHPLEILQAQIQLQRQQFNLSDSRPLPMRESNVRKTNTAVRKTGTTLPGEVDVDVLMAEENSTWYVPSEQSKEPEVPWEQTRKTTATSKGRTNTSHWPPSDMKVYLL